MHLIFFARFVENAKKIKRFPDSGSGRKKDRSIKMLRKTTADVVVIGAGIAGCSAFYNLVKASGMKNFRPILLDECDEPLQLTRCLDFV